MTFSGLIIGEKMNWEEHIYVSKKYVYRIFTFGNKLKKIMFD